MAHEANAGGGTKEGDRYLTPVEAGAYLSYSPSTLYALVRDDRIPYHRRGKALRFKLSELDAWVSGEWEG